LTGPEDDGDPSFARAIGRPGPADQEGPGPLDGFVHDIDFTRFDQRFGRSVPLLLAALVALIAANGALQPALGAGAAIAIGLGSVVLVSERERWRAQDVFQWYQKERQQRWVRETGGPSPGGDPAAAEIWLGVHRPGTVPQIYRALAALHSGDTMVIGREIAAMPDLTPADQAWKGWLIQTERFARTGTADVTAIAPLVRSLPPSPDRSLFESWLATVEAMRRRSAGDRHWIRPLADQRSAADRTELGFRRRARIWASRFAVVIVFIVSTVVFMPIAAAVSGRGDTIPPEYASTTYSFRGDLPGLDEAKVARALLPMARALPGAVRRHPAPLDDEAFYAIIDAGIPTFIWTTGAIDIAGPADQSGLRVWELEYPLGLMADAAPSVIVTFDRENGPRYLYSADPALVATLRSAVGLGQ
jgi:hypothetical protein